MSKFKPYLEHHKYAPELNTLHLSPTRSIKVGFFNMNYNPTFQDAMDYAYEKGLISNLERWIK